MSTLTAFFQPRSIAFVGASEDESKLGGRRFRSLVEGGFAGEIHPVHPRAAAVRGLPAHRSVRDVPGPIDLVVIVVPAEAVMDALADCAARAVPAVMLITAGFGEIDADGKRQEAEMATLIRRAGGRLIGPNCAGLYAAGAGINLGGADVPAGSIALISQSGNLLLDFNLRAKASGLGFSRQVAIGNAADVDGVALITDSLDDPETSVVLAYLEGFGAGRGRTLAEAVRDHPGGKPVVVLMPGRSEAGRRAALTHTGALAAETRVAEDVLRDAGVIRARSIEEAWTLVDALSRCSPLRGDRVALVSDGGGHATVLADGLGLAGLSMPAFSAETQEALAAFLPSRAAIANPLDFAGVVESDPSVLPEALRICLAAPEVDAVALAGHFGGYHRIGGAALETREIAAATAVADLMRELDRPLVVQSIHADIATRSHDILRDAGAPVLRTPEAAASALAGLRDAGIDQARPRAARPAPSLPGAIAARCTTLLNTAAPSGALAEPECRALLETAGLDMPPAVTVTSAEAATAAGPDWGPVAMKLITPSLVHRSDAGGVILDVDGGPARAEAASLLLSRCPEAERAGARVLVTPMIEAGIEIICGAFRDPQFGPVIMTGVGGTAVEVMEDVVFRLAPLAPETAHAMIAGIRAQRLLDGHRGGPAVDRAALAAILVQLGDLLATLPDLAEIELNPVIMNAGGALVADARATVRRAVPD